MTELRWYQDANLRTARLQFRNYMPKYMETPEFEPVEVDRLYLTEWENVPTVYEEQP